MIQKSHSWACIKQNFHSKRIFFLFLFIFCFFFFFLQKVFINFGDESLVSRFTCKDFLPFCGLSFCVVQAFLCCAETLRFDQVPFVYFCFCCQFSDRWIREDVAVVYVRECLAYVFLQEFDSVWSYVQVFNPFGVYFCVWCQGVF